MDAASRHLKRLMESYGGDVELDLAADTVARSAGIPHLSARPATYVKRITQIYYGGSDARLPHSGRPRREPLQVTRDDRGVLNFGDTD